MGLLQNLIKNIGADKKIVKAKLKDAEQDRKVQRLLDEREKSANQRELERYMKEQREENITETLNKIRKEKNKELWSGSHSVLKSEYNILKTERPILKEKNIFKGHSTSLLSKKNMFMQ